MIRVLVDSRIRVDRRELFESLEKRLVAEFTHRNRKRVAMESAGIRGFWNEPRVIATWSENGNELSFPRGGMSRVRDILRDEAAEFRVVDARVEGDVASLPDTRVSLWPHQERIVQACLARQNALIRSGTGSGKTSALLALIGRVNVPSLVIVHSAKLLSQWVERAVFELGMRESEVGILGGGKRRLRDLTIGIQKSVAAAAADPEFLLRWGLVAADEVHLFAASTFFGCVDPFPAKYRLGVSDDARRKDQKEFLVYDLFGPEACEVTDAELVSGGFVMPVEVMVVPTAFEAPWYGTPEDENDERRPDYGRLLAEMSASEARNAIVAGIVATELAEGRQVLAFATERDHCRTIGAAAASGARAGYLIGGPDYSSEYDRTLRGLRDGTIRVGVGTYQACGTGTDLPSVEIGIACTPVLANRSRFRQARGRLCRKPAGKTVARFYVLWDRKIHGLRHLENAAKWNGSQTFVWEEAERAWIPAKTYLKRARAR